MKKTASLLAILFFFLFLSFHESTIPARKITLLNKLEPELRDIVYSFPSRHIRVIVWLNGSGETIEHLQHFGKVKHEYEIIPAVAMEMIAKDLDGLVSLPWVERVTMDRKVTTFRMESMSIMRTDEVKTNFGVNGTGINISVIDTGVFNHTEFQTPNRIIKQKCFCAGNPGSGGCCPNGGEEDENATDDNGHGTHCAGIAAGKGNGYGHGVAQNASLLVVKVLDSSGSGYDSDIVKGIEWAVDNGANILSLSFGVSHESFTDCYDVAVSEAVDNATKNGVLVVVAAGNNGPEQGTIAAPACAKRALTVGSSMDGSYGATPLDNVSSFSSRGPTNDNRTKPDLLACGEWITSTYLSTENCEPGINNGYCTLKGTSQAAPHVAGIAALLMEEYRKTFGYIPEPDRVKAILLTAVNTSVMRSNGYTQRNNIYGSGRIDAYQALNMMNFTRNASISENQTVMYNLNVTSGTDELRVTLYWPEDKYINNNLDLILSNSTINFTHASDANDSVEQVFVDNPSEGIWKVYVEGKSVDGTQDYYLASNVEIIDDVTAPQLVLVLPENKTYTNRTFIPLNFTTDASNNTIWYTLNGENETVVTSNTTFNVSDDGTYCITLYVNDSLNNINQSTRYFSVDTVAPVLTILSPLEDEVVPTNMVWFNISLNEVGNVSLFSVDGMGNNTMQMLNSTYFFNSSLLTEGYHNVSFYVNDTVGWTNSSSINFSVMVKPSFNGYTIDRPLILPNESVNVSTSVMDENIDKVWINITREGYSFTDLMDNESSFYYFTFNETNCTGSYKVVILANDTFGNENNVSLHFVVANATSLLINVSDGTSPVNVSMKLLFNGTEVVRNETTNTSFSFDVPEGLWDIWFNTSELQVLLREVNLSERVGRSVEINENVSPIIDQDLVNIKTVVFQPQNFSFSFANMTFKFNESLITSYENLEVYKCGYWNFTNASCNGTWVNDTYDESFNATINQNNVSLVTLSFSAFSLSETQTTTTSTSTSTTTTTISDGGGNGGRSTTTSTTTTSSTTTSTVSSTTTTTSITIPVCGNGVCEKGETQESCCSDCGCMEGYECKDNSCVEKKVMKVEKVKRYWFVVFLPLLLPIAFLVWNIYSSRARIRAEEEEFRKLKEKWSKRRTE